MPADSCASTARQLWPTAPRPLGRFGARATSGMVSAAESLAGKLDGSALGGDPDYRADDLRVLSR